MPTAPEERSLDEWYRLVNTIYLDRNFYRDASSVFAHLVEVMGGLSLLASDKEKPGVVPERFIPKAIAWWMALCGKVGVRSVEDMLWWKFPGVCSYCHQNPHVEGLCRQMKQEKDALNWETLEQLGRNNFGNRPKKLASWLLMFGRIYVVSGTEDYKMTFARFTEELGELAEALRVFPAAPGYFLSEAADVFAWIMHLQNLVYLKGKMFDENDRARALYTAFSTAYPDRCNDCGNPVCTCPPILPGTLGRIAHEVSGNRASYTQGGALLPIDKIIQVFELGSRTIHLGQQAFEVDSPLVHDIHSVVTKLREYAIENRQMMDAHSIELVNSAEAIKELTSAQRVTQDSVEELAQVIASLPSESRTAVVSFLNNIGAGAWLAALIELVKYKTHSPW
ncbi:MAG: hypothetical protein ACREDR_04245 [Blastocatellia bacterium]